MELSITYNYIYIGQAFHQAKYQFTDDCLVITLHQLTDDRLSCDHTAPVDS